MEIRGRCSLPGLSKFLMGLYFSCCGFLNNAAHLQSAWCIYSTGKVIRFILSEEQENVFLDFCSQRFQQKLMHFYLNKTSTT